MTVVLSTKGDGYSPSVPTEGYLFLRRKGQPAATGPGVICLHGHGSSSTQFAPYGNRNLSPGYGAMVLAREGFRVLAIDDMGAADWGSADSSARVADAVAYLQGTLGARVGKVGLMGWSMGGLAALNWIDGHSAQHACSWLWAPCSDLEWAYGNPLVGQNPTWSSEIDTAYSAEGTRAGYSPIAKPGIYRGVGPIRSVHAVDDATIPIQQSRDFVTAVNDSGVTLKEVASGGHTALFGGVTDLEVVQFFRSNLGVPAS